MSHHDHHHHDEGQKITAKDKITHIIRHWINHNEDHRASYSEWASRASEMGLDEVAGILKEVAEDARIQSDRLQKALALMEKAI
jgi:rubrerythrin